MSLLAKENGKLTPEDRQKLFKAIGTAALPYPASHFITDSNGQLQTEIGIIADDANPLGVYADQSHEHVVGLLYRDMAIPSLLHVQKEAILRRAPDSRHRLMAILGDPGSGKSHLAKMMARVRDSRPAEVIDCGGHYMGDLVFEQVIDYGEDFKTALTQRIQSGTLSARSTKILQEQFSEALELDETGKITGIDWDKASRAANSEKLNDFESLEQAMQVARLVAEYESIPTQTVNSIGVKKVPGVIIRAFQEGRELVLDEYTKSIEGSDDSLQTVLQFLNGEGDDEITVTNSLKVSGREETYAYTLRRSDMKPGFFVTLTGNKQSDGFSTHPLSRSAYSRIPVFTIENPLAIDWKHRISQIMTGLPLSTLYAVFADMAREDPQEFGDLMIELRLMGLSEDEKAKVPQQQITLLKNWEQTNVAVEKLAHFYMYWAQIIDPQSDLYDPAKPQNASNIENIMPEISAAYRDESAIDFRKVIQDISNALSIKPDVKTIQPGSSLRLNFSAVGREKIAIPALHPETVSSGFGSRLESTLLERIGTMTAGRPKLQEGLIKEAHERGILAVKAQNANALQPETIEKLLNQDGFSDISDPKSVETLRYILDHVKKTNPELQGKPDQEIISKDDAATACAELARLSAEAIDVSPRLGRAVLIGDGLTSLFNRAAAVDTIGQDQKPDPAQLVRSVDFLNSLKIPALADINMQGIWRKTLSAEKLLPESPEVTAIVQLAEGTHDSKIAITTLMMQNAKGDPVPVHIIQDDERKKSLIVTDDVPEETKDALLGRDYAVVAYNDDGAESLIAGFVQNTLRHPSRKDRVADLERQIACAFALRAGNQNNMQPLAQMMADKNQTAGAPVYMINTPA